MTRDPVSARSTSPPAPSRAEWTLPDDVTYLNHGSFGPSPRCVQRARQAWSDQLEREPMDFFVRRMEERLEEAAVRLGAFVGAPGGALVFIDNATAAMNVVAANTPLGPGDEVLAGDHEYGAVLRLWRSACRRAGARLVVQPLPVPVSCADELTDALFTGASPRTRLLVVSHVTSPTAIVFPVEAICRRAKEQGIAVCVDGPHALGMLPLDLRRIECDFYTASCHKWLSAPFGSGFLYVAPKRQQKLRPVVTSWGRSLAGRPASWKDEFQWSGTRDPAPFLAVPAAIDFLEACGLERFRRETHALARAARHRILPLTGEPALTPDDAAWYGSMVSVPLPVEGAPPPAGHADPLQTRLWTEERIEVPIMHWKGRRLLRVSCHLYNSAGDIDRLAEALRGRLR